MSGLHQIAPTSFFPTAKELSGGLKWFKDHPILAAAAATAVSVITYLNTTADDVSDGDEVITNTILEEVDLMEQRDEYDRELVYTRQHLQTTSTSSSNVTAGRTPPALRKPGSDGKMSPAAVSWVDEHGGSLTEVFEHLSTSDEEDYPDLDKPTPRRRSSTPSPRHGLPPHPRRAEDRVIPLNGEELATSDETTWKVHPGSPGTVPFNPSVTPELLTESPQWGWYVAITPPQDQHNCHANLPRGIPHPVRPGSGKQVVSGIVGPTGSRRVPIVHPASATADDGGQPRRRVGGAGAMRRSTSGRITSSA